MGGNDGTTPRRARWAAVVAAIAVVLGSGGLMTASATLDSGARPVFIAITPCRTLDTRTGPGTPVGAGATLTVGVRVDTGGCASVPPDAVGLSLNVAIVFPDASSFLTVFPADVVRPPTANANWSAGDAPRSNAVNTKISADGRVSFFNAFGNVHLVVDVNGYYVDHTHDDRYYTKAQMDGLLAAKASNPVTSAQILDATITGADLASNSVTGDKVLDGSLSNEDISVYFADVGPDGVVFRSSPAGVTGARFTGEPAGKYRIDFGRDVSQCSYSVTQGTPVAGLFYSQSPFFKFGYFEASPLALNPNLVGVMTYNTSELPADMPFHLIVVC